MLFWDAKAFSFYIGNCLFRQLIGHNFFLLLCFLFSAGYSYTSYQNSIKCYLSAWEEVRSRPARPRHVMHFNVSIGNVFKDSMLQCFNAAGLSFFSTKFPTLSQAFQSTPKLICWLKDAGCCALSQCFPSVISETETLFVRHLSVLDNTSVAMVRLFGVSAKDF